MTFQRTRQEESWQQIPTLVHASKDCMDCQRLCAFREALREDHPDWHNAPVNGFGNMDAKLLILGLAPGMKGANATGRPFTGDGAGNILFSTLKKFDLAAGEYGGGVLDDFSMKNSRIVNAVRCLPPKNKPNMQEITACNHYLQQELRAMENLKVVLVLGQVAHQGLLKCLHKKISQHRFGHANEFCFDLEGRSLRVINSYHCSRYNTQTKRLTPEMFENIFARACELADL